jgi:hypothetical protein
MPSTSNDGQVTGQHAELLPARTVLSTLTRASGGGHNGGGKGPLDGLKVDIPLLNQVLGNPSHGADGTTNNGSQGSRGASSHGI